MCWILFFSLNKHTCATMLILSDTSGMWEWWCGGLGGAEKQKRLPRRLLVGIQMELGLSEDEEITVHSFYYTAWTLEAKLSATWPTFLLHRWGNMQEYFVRNLHRLNFSLNWWVQIVIKLQLHYHETVVWFTTLHQNNWSVPYCFFGTCPLKPFQICKSINSTVPLDRNVAEWKAAIPSCSISK